MVEHLRLTSLPVPSLRDALGICRGPEPGNYACNSNNQEMNALLLRVTTTKWTSLTSALGDRGTWRLGGKWLRFHSLRRVWLYSTVYIIWDDEMSVCTQTCVLGGGTHLSVYQC